MGLAFECLVSWSFSLQRCNPCMLQAGVYMCIQKILFNTKVFMFTCTLLKDLKLIFDFQAKGLARCV
jgi:hypothetical protein